MVGKSTNIGIEQTHVSNSVIMGQFGGDVAHAGPGTTK